MAKDPRTGAYTIGVVSMRYGRPPQPPRLHEPDARLTPSPTHGKPPLTPNQPPAHRPRPPPATRPPPTHTRDRVVYPHHPSPTTPPPTHLERLAQALEAAGVKDVPRPASGTGLVKLTPHGLRKR
mgnify:CR=1 FL=1